MAVIQFPPLPALLFPPPAPKSRPPVLLPFWSTAPHAHIPRPRPSREFHIGNAQVRRNADGCVPGTTPRMGVRLCSPAVIRVSPRCAAPPAGGAVCRPGPARPRRPRGRCGLGLCSWGNQPGVFSVALLRGGGAKSVSLFDLRRELKFAGYQTILKYRECDLGETKGFVGLWACLPTWC